DHQRYAVRQKAERELEKLGSLAEPAVRRAMMETQSLEIRSRAGRVLPKLAGKTPGELLRAVRSLEVLENIGNTEARKVLEAVAKEEDRLGIVEEAMGALERLKSRRQVMRAKARP